LSSFPFSAVVGHDDVKLALLLNALDPRIGGVLLRGQKGSAKSTLARGLARVLTAPFVELPVGATEDRVVGTLDFESALTAGRRRFHPGLLAAADGGVLYVDEVNLLPDHLVDVLLDVAASGVNRVEREGVSEAHPSRFVLVGSMNPEEGDLRPQLLDRFGLSVEVTSSADPGERAEAVRRRMAHDEDPDSFRARWAEHESDLRRHLAGARPARLPEDLVLTVSRMCASLGAEGLRADLVICRAAAALAGWEGREEASTDDVARVAHLALGHRRRRGPFDEPGVDQAEIDRALQESGSSGPDDQAGGDDPRPLDGPGSGEPSDSSRTAPPAAPSEPTRVVPLRAGRTDASDSPSGRRSPVQGRRGRLVGDRPPGAAVGDVAVGPTVRAAAARRSADPSGPMVSPADLREAVREQRAGNLVVLTVDASASMGVERRMEAVKGAVLSLLLDAYQRRDRVSLVTFRGDSAEVALRPTGSVEVARARLAELPTGGRTPLAAGIRTALTVAEGAGGQHRPLLVVLSDGRATSAAEGEDPLGAARSAAAEVRRRGLPSVVIDAEDGPTRLGLAAELAGWMGARLLSLPELSAGALAGAVRQAVVP